MRDIRPSKMVKEAALRMYIDRDNSEQRLHKEAYVLHLIFKTVTVDRFIVSLKEQYKKLTERK